MSKPKAIIVDVDGTVADMGKGQPGRRGPFDWDRVGEDQANWKIVKLVRMFRGRLTQDDSCEVIWVSGRNEVCRPATRQWLQDCGAGYPHDSLFMRKDGDFRPDEIVKEEIYRQDIESFWNVQYVLDDRNKVVRMWRSLGLTCLQVADGDF